MNKTWGISEILACTYRSGAFMVARKSFLKNQEVWGQPWKTAVSVSMIGFYVCIQEMVAKVRERLTRGQRQGVVSRPIYRWPVRLNLWRQWRSKAYVLGIRFWGCLLRANKFKQRNPAGRYTSKLYLGPGFATVSLLDVDVEWWRYRDTSRYRYRYRSCDRSEVCHHVIAIIWTPYLGSVPGGGYFIFISL